MENVHLLYECDGVICYVIGYVQSSDVIQFSNH